jgi:hypothetical protein
MTIFKWLRLAIREETWKRVLSFPELVEENDDTFQKQSCALLRFVIWYPIGEKCLLFRSYP